ncbi:heme exporter protein CcmB [Legionella spiritensis]|uniref:Heme exporter protein B n=1 Tax=Legionella spiritensis TaxID=452 RepID=A0A0W0Z8S2_LEGSP|nr:heme exporter protein CcmB [Legionella spiritensis]KTD65500.1 heme exporter protein CcmB [Legionella spiritensis]SNV35960.1 heme exporter protein CcmB [Legionella spiritensis]VEG89888.1 heme exporter protein CcmB [Legionella spiritensis]
MIPAGKLFAKQCHREILLHIRQPRGLLYTTIFFLMITVFFPLTMTPDSMLMRRIVPGLVWTAMLLASLLASERLFQQDYEEGVIEQWLVSGESLSLIVGAKISVHWLLNLLPMLLLCPLVAVLFSLSGYETVVLIASLVAGTPAIIFLCALAAAFNTGMQQKGVLIALILLPLALPVMIFGSGTLNAAMYGVEVRGFLAILLALSILAAAFLPLAISAVIRISLAD